jgi:hypothetical protein
MKQLLFILLVSLCLSGCAGKVGESYVGTLPAGQAVDRIAGDAVERLASLYPPGRTSLHLISPTKGDSFSAELENGLRGKGFTLSSTGPVRVAWVLNSIEPEKTWYLRLKTADSSGTRTLSRAYGLQGEPLAGFAEIKE